MERFNGMDFDEVAEAQGWNEQSMIAILRSFISQCGHQEELDTFAREWAAEEEAATKQV